MPVSVLNPSDKEGFAGVSILGVDDTQPPSLSNFPRTFNPGAFNQWKVVLESKDYLNVKGNTKSASKLWYTAIGLYLKACNRVGAFPFHTTNQQSRNDTVISHLRAIRLVMADYFEEAGFFKKVQMRLVNRRYHIEEGKFVIETEAMLYPFEDPTFRQWLQHLFLPRMLPRQEEPRTYERRLDYLGAPGVTAWCKTGRKLVMSLGYTIVCPTTPVYPISNKIPSNEQMADFIENTIWLPLIRSRKIKDAGLRLF